MAPDRDDGRVVVHSDGTFELDPLASAGAPFELREERHTVVCSSGERETGDWRGIPIGDLLERAGPSDDDTHLLVTGDDGYRVCVPVAAALDALLAVARLDADADGTLPRFLGSAVGGTRSVKRVRRLETVALAPGEDPGGYEQLTADGSA